MQENRENKDKKTRTGIVFASAAKNTRLPFSFCKNSPSPPPPNAGEVQPNVNGENLTVRERLQQHRNVAACANCHRRIDPYGLALENFNAIGQWRTKQDGEKRPSFWRERKPLKISGILPNGDRYTNFAEFKAALNKQHARFVQGLSEKLFTYALGRPIDSTDRDAIQQIVKQTNQNGLTIRSMLTAIATSEAFRTK